MIESNHNEIKLTQRCPHCNGELMKLSYIDPMSFTAETITKVVCTKCHREFKEESITNNISTVSNKSDTCPVCNNLLFTDCETGNKNCATCGYSEVKLPHTLVNEHSKDLEDRLPVLYGWICPTCGASLSPWTTSCPHCSMRDWTVTCEGTSGTSDVLKAMSSSSVDLDINIDD